ncbi:MAG: TrkH family potassium uptake protein [Paracoccaceae bacterium]
MIDLRPIAYVVGRILIVLAILMLAPALVDYRYGSTNWRDFLEASVITGGAGGAVALATMNGLGRGLDARQAYLLTVSIWILVPMFGALPLMLGAPGLNFTDAYFEAVSGITTTGSTVIVGLDNLPAGMNLWRGMLNWLGGLGIAFVAMIFLPVMRVGGMQFFRTEGFDTFGKALPRATDIARQLLLVYFAMTVVCAAVYSAIGMSDLDAVVHALASIATGGFSPRDASFNAYAGAGEYAGGFFLIIASFPYIRYVQLMNGHVGPLWRDRQVWGYLRIIAAGVGAVTLWRVLTSDMGLEPAFREAFFNLASVISGTGFFSGTYTAWGGFALVVAFVMGLIGGCSGSSSGALTVFRVQVTGAALLAQIRRINAPSRISPVKYDGRTVDADTLGALMLYVTGYLLTIGVMSVACTLTGVDTISALFGIWSSIGNIGYGVGPMLAETGTYRDFPEAAKWIMIVTMLMGRLALLAMFLVVLPRFWQR